MGPPQSPAHYLPSPSQKNGRGALYEFVSVQLIIPLSIGMGQRMVFHPIDATILPSIWEIPSSMTSQSPSINHHRLATAVWFSMPPSQQLSLQAHRLFPSLFQQGHCSLCTIIKLFSSIKLNKTMMFKFPLIIPNYLLCWRWIMMSSGEFRWFQMI